MDPVLDPVEMVTDRGIRRGLCLAGVAIGAVMLSLAYDLPLAIRCGADLVAVTSVVMLMAAWYSPRRDMRRSFAWSMLNNLRPEVVRGRSRTEMQRRLQEVLRRRLVWHAQRTGAVAVALWGLTAVLLAVRAR